MPTSPRKLSSPEIVHLDESSEFLHSTSVVIRELSDSEYLSLCVTIRSTVEATEVHEVISCHPESPFDGSEIEHSTSLDVLEDFSPLPLGPSIEYLEGLLGDEAGQDLMFTATTTEYFVEEYDDDDLPGDDRDIQDEWE